MLRPVSGGLRPLVQNRRESVRVEFRVPPGAVVAVDDDVVADELVASGDFVDVEPVAEVASAGEEPVPAKRGPGRPRKG